MPEAWRQLRQEILIALTRVAPHNAAQRRIGLQCPGVDPDRLAFHELGMGQPLQHPREHGLMRLDIDQPPCARPSNDRAALRVARDPEGFARSTNRWRARRSRARSPALRSTRATASESSVLAANPDAQSRWRKSAGRAIQRSRQSWPAPGSDSVECGRGCAALRGRSCVATHMDAWFGQRRRLPIAIRDTVVRRIGRVDR
jgi:hypothetical protein